VIQVRFVIHHYSGTKALRRILLESLAFLGFLEIIVNLLIIFRVLDLPTIGIASSLWWVIAVSLVGFFVIILRHRPISYFEYKDDKSDVSIVVKMGDLFKEDENMVIGVSDCFDTEVGDVISQRSIQGQFTAKYYSGDSSKLDKDLVKGLRKMKVVGEVDEKKKRGKKTRYPIGTTVVLDCGEKKVFACAYAKMKPNLMAETSMGDLWRSLNSLWEKIREKGEMKEVAMPVVGARFARIKGGVTYKSLVRLLLMSYITFARTQNVSKRLTLVIHKSREKDLSLYRLRSFLQEV